jgi:hypothetical protein
MPSYFLFDELEFLFFMFCFMVIPTITYEELLILQNSVGIYSNLMFLHQMLSFFHNLLFFSYDIIVA